MCCCPMHSSNVCWYSAISSSTEKKPCGFGACHYNLFDLMVCPTCDMKPFQAQDHGQGTLLLVFKLLCSYNVPVMWGILLSHVFYFMDSRINPEESGFIQVYRTRGISPLGPFVRGEDENPIHLWLVGNSADPSVHSLGGRRWQYRMQSPWKGTRPSL